MPSRPSSPRSSSGRSGSRPSGAGRPTSGRPSTGADPRRKSSGFNGAAGRTPRDGAERRIDRATGSGRPSTGAARGRDDRGDRPDRPYADRAPRRFDRDDRSEGDRRPRPPAAGRTPGRPAARPGARDDRGPRSDARPFNREPRSDARPYSRDSRSEARPYSRDDRSESRPYSRDDRSDARPYSRDSRPSRDDRPRTGAGRPPRDGAPRAGARPSGRPLPPSKTRNPNARTGRAPREVSPEELEKQRADAYGRNKGWGGVARKGGMNIKSTGQAMESTPTAGWTPDPLSAWVEEVRPTREAPAPKAKPKVKYALPGDVAADIRKAFIGTAYMREKMVITLTKAAEGYDRKRYEEALRLGRIVSDAVPGVAAVRELTGLAAYRAERWNMAKIHLRAHFAITGDPEHLPLVMDCDRANRRFRAVEKTYEEIQENEPSAEVIAEARIVMGSALADQKMYTEAIDLLVRAGGTKMLRNPAYRHVRLWYALADVFDRSGDQVSARELFARVVVADPDAYDAKARLEELGATAPKKNRKRRTTPVSKKKVD